jgi:carbon-monoxide dehydrogenase large subunit
MAGENVPKISPIIQHRAGHLGRMVPRREDRSALLGLSQYVADIRLPGMVEVAFVRSSVPHALIRSIDTSLADQIEGVLGIVTAQDLEGVEQFPHFIEFNQPVHQFPLARDRVRYVGSPYAAVIATDRYVAEDAANLVAGSTDFESLPTIATIDQALAENAPRLYDDWPDNRLTNALIANSAVDRAFVEADHTYSETYTSQRQTGLPIETRGVVATVREGQLTVWTSNQSPHIARTTIAMVLGVPEPEVRVITPAMGGGFGTKCHVYPEEVVVAWLAKKLNRPVRWIEDRAEHLVSAVHARDQRHDVQIAYDDDGTIRGIRVHSIGDVGSGEVFMPGTAPTFVTGGSISGAYDLTAPTFVTGGSISGAYDLPNIEIKTTCVVTNKTPSGAYRGFGIPEAGLVRERIVDRVARLTGVDRVELRRRLVLRDSQLPYKMPAGGIVDSGSHAQAFERALELADPLLAQARDKHAQDADVRVGIGYANYVEPTAPTYFLTTGFWAGYDSATVRVDSDGKARVGLGLAAIGQGAETTAASVTAEALSLQPADVTVVMGDTERSPYGLGAWGSRGAIVMSGSILMATDRLLDKARRIAAHMLDVGNEDIIQDIVLRDGSFSVEGQPERRIGWSEVATAAWARTVDLPEGMEHGLESSGYYDPVDLEHTADEAGRLNAAATWANGTHIAIVSVRLSTGEIKIEDYVVVHDCGRMLHPGLVEGQVHGGVAQGIAGSLYEYLRYDPDTAQPQFASFLEYLVPTCAEIPKLTLDHFESYAPHMPLGVKGAGEGGTIGGPAAITGAVSDALAEFGVFVTDTPITPVTVRAALRSTEEVSS